MAQFHKKESVTPASRVLLRRGPRRPIPRLFGCSDIPLGDSARIPRRATPFIRGYLVLCNTALGVIDRRCGLVTSRHVPLAPLLVYISLCIRGLSRSCIYVHIQRNSSDNKLSCLSQSQSSSSRHNSFTRDTCACSYLARHGLGY